MKKLFWKLYSIVESLYSISDKQAFVVIGFPRSGTSLLSRLLDSCGVYFGDTNSFRPSDWRNPEGFFEHVEVNKIDYALMLQSNNPGLLSFGMGSSLRASGVWKQFRRMLLRLRMRRFLHGLSRSGDKWGFKSFPASFYFWAPYLPGAKFIAIYRDPRESAFSNQRTFNRFTFDQLVAHWTHAHRELLYHLSTHPHLLIRLDDLENPATRERILDALRTFVGSGDREKLTSILHTTRKKTKSLVLERIPITAETQGVLDALDSLRVR